MQQILTDDYLEHKSGIGLLLKHRRVLLIFFFTLETVVLSRDVRGSTETQGQEPVKRGSYNVATAICTVLSQCQSAISVSLFPFSILSGEVV